jgi:ABC-2 type transport system permease protein
LTVYYLRLIGHFMRISALNELSYRANFAISLLHGLLSLGTGVLGVAVVFGQVDRIQGWDFDSTLAILGVYLTVGAARGLFISPGLEALAGMGGEVWDGRFDFTLLQPVDVQFLVSVRHWRPLALFDLALGLGTLGAAIVRLGQTLTPPQILSFVIALGAGLTILYAILLVFAALIFWSPGFLFTWLFDGLFQMARYPVGLYPAWLRLVLTWIVPVGVVTTVPAQALTGALAAGMLPGSVILAAGLFAAASIFFRRAVRRYASASS